MKANTKHTIQSLLIILFFFGWLPFAGFSLFFGSYLPFALQDDADHLDMLERLTLKQTEAAWLAGTETRDAKLYFTEGRLRLAATRLNCVAVVTNTSYAGEVDPRNRFIKINPNLGHDAQLMTLAHELGHVLEPLEWQALDGMHEDEEEVFAEAVSFLVVSAERNETSSYVNYLVRHKNALSVLRTHRKEIIFAANFIRGEQ